MGVVYLHLTWIYPFFRKLQLDQEPDMSYRFDPLLFSLLHVNVNKMCSCSRPLTEKCGALDAKARSLQLAELRLSVGTKAEAQDHAQKGNKYATSKLDDRTRIKGDNHTCHKKLSEHLKQLVIPAINLGHAHTY